MSIESPLNEEELELVESRMAEAATMITAAKVALLRYRPFYGTLVSSMPVHVDYTWLNTIATNGRDLFYNPEFIAGWDEKRQDAAFKRVDSLGHLSKKGKDKLKENLEVFYRKKTISEVIFLLEHEIRHVICDHMSRGKGYIHRLFNIAADHYINVSLLLEHSTPAGMGRAWFKGETTVLDRKKEFGFLLQGYMNVKYKGWVTEKIYEDLMKDENSSSSGKNMPIDQHMGDGSNKGKGQNDPQEEGQECDDPDQKDMSKAVGTNPEGEPIPTSDQEANNRELIQRAIKSAVDASTAAGQPAPEDIRKWVAEMGKAKINYVQLIDRTLRSLIKTDVSYRRPAKKGLALTHTLRGNGTITRHQTIVLPKRICDESIDVWIGFDVSGSVTDALLKRIFKEIMGLTLQFKQFKIHLFCWSTHVGTVMEYTKKNIREISSYKINTSYGTHVSCVYEYLEKQKAKVDQLIVFTDGYFENISTRTDWAKKYKTLWVIFDNAGFKAPFGKAVDFDKHVK